MALRGRLVRKVYRVHEGPLVRKGRQEFLDPWDCRDLPVRAGLTIEVPGPARLPTNRMMQYRMPTPFGWRSLPTKDPSQPRKIRTGSSWLQVSTIGERGVRPRATTPT